MNLKKKLMAFAVSMGAMMLVVSPLPVRAAEVDSQSYSVLETEIESNEVYMVQLRMSRGRWLQRRIGQCRQILKR